MTKTSQNELLLCIKEYIKQEIVNDIKNQKDGPFFGLSADEVADISNWEALGTIVRYVKDCEPIERLLEFVPCEYVKGKCICNYLVKALQDSSLDPKMYCSQTLDGAGNLSGKTKADAAQFCLKIENEKAVYFHCASHELKLRLSKMPKVPQVSNMISTVQFLGLFYNISQKRQRKLELSISLKNPGNNLIKSKAKPMCGTRLVERHMTFEDLPNLCELVIHCLESIQHKDDLENRFDSKTVIEASGLLKQLQNPGFIILFQTCR